METEKELCQQAINKWGLPKQLDMAAEECAELVHAIMKFKRHPENPIWKDNVIEEAADVSIMLQQLIMMVGSDDEFHAMKKVKLQKLKSQIDFESKK